MPLLSDISIRERAQDGMITPFQEKQVSSGMISYGLSSFGYDPRLAPEFKMISNTFHAVLDPKKIPNHAYVNHEGEHCIIPPHGFVLGRTVENFCIPRDVLVLCIGKSTYARCGIVVNVTPLEPEQEGHITLEFSNTTPLPVKLYAGEGACQFLFFQGDRACETSYKDRGGKYMGQRGVNLPRI